MKMSDHRAEESFALRGADDVQRGADDVQGRLYHTYPIPALEVSNTRVSVESQSRHDVRYIFTVHVPLSILSESKSFPSESYFRLYLNYFKETTVL